MPYLLRWPGRITAGSVCGEPINSVDLYPTLLELAGAKPAPGQILDGTSYLGLLTGATADAPRRPLFWHFPGYLGSGAGTWRTTPVGVIREGDWKLLEFFETGRIELYHLRADLGEKNDRAAAPPGKVKGMRAKLAAWRTEIKAPMPAKQTEADLKTEPPPASSKGRAQARPRRNGG